MEAGASAFCQAAIKAASNDELSTVIQALPESARARVTAALGAAEEGKTPLIQAAEHGEVDVVRTLLATSDKDSINKRDNYGNTALVYAVSYLHYDIVGALLEAGASLEACGRSECAYKGAYKGPVCMMMATRNGDGGEPENKQKVLDAMASAGAPRPTESELAIEDRCMKGAAEGKTPLIMAAEDGEADVVRTLLATADKESVNTKDDFGNTALCYAVSYLYFEIVDALLKAGSSVEACARMEITDEGAYKGPGCMMNAARNGDGGDPENKQKVLDAMASAGAPRPTESEVAIADKNSGG